MLQERRGGKGRGEERRGGEQKREERKEGDRRGEGRRGEDRRGEERRGVRAPQLAAGPLLKLFLLTANQLCNGHREVTVRLGQPKSTDE